MPAIFLPVSGDCEYTVPNLATALTDTSPVSDLYTVLLLLLRHLLLTRRWWRLLGQGLRFLYQDGPVFGYGHLLVKQRCTLAWRNAHGYSELAVSSAAEDAMRWRDVGIVPADGRANVPVARD